MQIPSKVKVAGADYTVEITDHLYATESLYGDVKYATQKIRIAGDISEQRQINTFFHELTHAILFEAGIYNLDDVKDDEVLVRKFSNVLTQVYVDNGWRFGG